MTFLCENRRLLICAILQEKKKRVGSERFYGYGMWGCVEEGLEAKVKDEINKGGKEQDVGE